MVVEEMQTNKPNYFGISIFSSKVSDYYVSLPVIGNEFHLYANFNQLMVQVRIVMLRIIVCQPVN